MRPPARRHRNARRCIARQDLITRMGNGEQSLTRDQPETRLTAPTITLKLPVASLSYFLTTASTNIGTEEVRLNSVWFTSGIPPTNLEIHQPPSL